MNKLSDLVPDSKNANKHSERGSALVQKSIQQYGLGRSILINRNNKIIAGNLTTEEAGQLGIEDVQIVESDGKKLVAVKRTDIDIDSAEGRGLALADNRASEISLNWNKEVLQELSVEYAEIFDTLFSETEKEILFESKKELVGAEFERPSGFDENSWGLYIEINSEKECEKLFSELNERQFKCKIIH